MRILSMQATFGKLDGDTLTLTPELNVITAPNEWGKSTWCSFIVAMLYGIETSQRSSSKGLADKERFAPWSGKPMSGRMDILWNDRKITIERASKGRSLLGAFKAYETDTGLEVSELTAENCGLTLLGVEKSVFMRAGFIRQTEMPVSDDLALRRRLNELVTTGDESGASDKLAQKLRELKNACRHNKTGLLPQAESQQRLLQDKLAAIEAASQQLCQIEVRQSTLTAEISALENHKAHLAYQDAMADLDRVANARETADKALARLRELETKAADLPAKDFAEKKLSKARQLQGELAQLQTKALPEEPEAPAVFRGISPEDACTKASGDKAEYDRLQKPLSPLLLILAVSGLLLGAGLLFIHPVLVLIGILSCGSFGFLHFRKAAKQKKGLARLTGRYGSLPADQWVMTAQRYADAVAAYRHSSHSFRGEKERLQAEAEALTGDVSLQDFMADHQSTVSLWQELDSAKEDARRAAAHAQALAAMVKEVPLPQAEDDLSWNGTETALRLAGCMQEQSELQKKAGSFMGQIQTLGSADDLQRQLQQVSARIARLEDTYAALTVAQETLAEASNELQRRFAPKIAEKAGALFARLTGGRYDRLLLGQDLSVSAGAEGEDTLHGAFWRSDGTVDQLYLSVRLAVAEALTPDAPIVLDDALVRFDENRLRQAMALLKEESGHKQVILFSCQDREWKYT